MSGTQQAPRPISLVVITLDGERHLASVLASARNCGERLVVDSGSTDATLTIASEAGARIEHQPFLGYGLQKQRAVELATHDWILSLDDDEVLDDEAADGIARIDLTDPTACWEIRRRTFVGSREIRHGAWAGDRVLRLFHRRFAGFNGLRVHEAVRAARPPSLLPGSIRHYSYDTSLDVIARSLRYAPLKARIIAEIGQRTGVLDILGRGFTAFLKSYVVKRGFLDGADGFTVAISRVIDATLPRAMVLAGETGEESLPS